jgi:hypothetical protein
MGYGYAETFLIIFLTHPGVLIPPTGAMLQKAMAYLPPDLAASVPTGGIPPFFSALWQAFSVWVLSLPGRSSPGFAWTMYALYLAFLLLYIYLIARPRFIQGI